MAALMARSRRLPSPVRAHSDRASSAASHAALARLLYDCRDLGGANDELKTAKALGAAYDAAPSHSARNVRFYEGVEHVGIYSDFGRSAMDAALDVFLGDDSTEKLEAFFRNA